jgi:hypothetical protein
MREWVEAASMVLPRGSDPWRQLAGVDRAHDLDRIIGEVLGGDRVEPDQLVVQYLAVLAELGDQRALDLEIAYSELDLRPVDWLGGDGQHVYGLPQNGTSSSDGRCSESW